MFTIYTQDNMGVTWYFKSKWLGYNWTTDIKKAKKYKDEKSARIMIRELWLNDRGLYKVHYI